MGSEIVHDCKNEVQLQIKQHRIGNNIQLNS